MNNNWNNNDRELAESGILLVDKPVDWTSHDVVNCVRRRFKVKKVGHCGTLDPNATGLLVLVLGRATRLSERLSGQDKIYSGTMLFGIETDSQDSAGKVTATHSCESVTADQVRNACAEFKGDLLQIPPMVSAVKMQGKPLYKLARQGIEVEREARPVRINYLNISRIEIPEIDFEVSCSKGFYVRTLCADIGANLGCGAHLLSLRRLRSGNFNVEQSFTLDEIKTWESDDLFEHMLSLAQLLDYLEGRK